MTKLRFLFFGVLTFTGALVVTDSLAQPTVYEAEPNDTPMDANPISGPVKLYGSMVNKDQDGFIWTVTDDDARKTWDFELHGIPGALTVVDLVKVEMTEDGTGVESYQTIMKMGTRDGVTPSIHRKQLFEPGEYLLGIAYAGGPSQGGGVYRPPMATLSFGDEAGDVNESITNELPAADSNPGRARAWQFLIRESGSLTVSRNPGGREQREQAQSVRLGSYFATYEALETAWYSFTFNEHDATQRWDIEIRSPIGRPLRARLVDGEGQALVDGKTDSHGRILFPGLAPAPGTWYLELTTSEPGFIQAVFATAAGQRVEGEEAEPNNTKEIANRVEFSQPVVGRINRSDSADIFRFEIDEPTSDQVLAFRVESNPPASMKVCLFDADWTTTQCRSQVSPVELTNLQLSPGEWGVSISRADETEYSLSMQTLGAIESGVEAEPNDYRTFATGVPENLRIKGQFDGADTDWYRFQIADEAQLWRFQVIGDNLHEVRYFNGAGEERASQRVDKGRRRVRLEDTYLLPGTHYLSLSAKEEEAGGEYTVLARPLGPPDPDGELEPNNSANKQRLAFGQTRNGLLADDVDHDWYRFFLPGEDHIRLTLTPPADGHVWMDMYWYSALMGNGRRDGPGEPLVIQGLFPPGDYSVKLNAKVPSDAEYTLSLERLPRFSCPADCEPNGMKAVPLAAPLPADLVLEGRAGDWGDWDYYQLPAFDAPVTLRVMTPEPIRQLKLGTAFHASTQLSYDSELGGYQAEVPAGDAQRLMVSSSGATYRLAVEFPNGEIEAVTEALPAMLDMTFEADTVAAFRRFGQELPGELRVTNTGDAELAVELEAATSDHRWHVNLEDTAVTVPAGAERVVPVTVLVPDDAWADRPVRISAVARDPARRQVETGRDIAVDRDVLPVGSRLDWPIAEGLRGGLNAAWAPFGATWMDSPNPVGRDRYMRDDVLFGGKNAFNSCRRDTLGMPEWSLDLPGDEPLPVAGFALNHFGIDKAFQMAHQVTLLVSDDGVEWEPVLSVDVPPLMTEQSFAMERSVPARFARLRIDAIWQEASYCYAVQAGEWKVVLEPGFDLSGGQGFDIAQLDLGGHVVRQIPLSASGPAPILEVDGNKETVYPRGWATRDYVIGFKRNRTAQVARVEWIELEGQEHGFDHLTVMGSLESPSGPWVRLGEVDIVDGENHAEVVLPRPEWARFIRVAARFKPDRKSALAPEQIKVWERPIDVEYRSVLSEWGDINYRAYYEHQAGVPATPEEWTSDNTSRDRAAPLAPGKPARGRVSLETGTAHWYRITLPADHNTLTIDLSGENTVRTILALEDEAGNPVPLRRIDPRTKANLNVFQAVLEPGGSAWLNVEEPPRNVVFAWDTSPSVASLIPRIRNTLVAYASEVVPGREAVNLMPFSSPPLLKQWLGQPYILQTALNEYDRGTGSSAALTTLKGASMALAPRAGSKAVLIITDGGTTPNYGAWPEMDEARPRIFGLQVAGDSRWNLDVMRDWSSVNAGHFSQLRYDGEMEVAYDRAATLMRRPAEYVLTANTEFNEAPGPGLLNVLRGENGPGSGGAAIALILDASGSMLQRVDGKRRIAVAREVLTEAVREQIPAGTPVALRVFGHREVDSCRTDLEIPLGPLDPAAAAEKIAGIQAMNLARTPIADSLAAVPGDLGGRTAGTVVLVTDGEETCDGDPAAVVESLREKGFNVTLNIVGFAIDEPELAAQFEAWATAGGGRYFGAADQAGLSGALAQALRVPFRVLDAGGNEVASGQVGGDAVELEPGIYRVIVATEPAQVFEDITVLGEDQQDIVID
ncbi:VWA domain-containing protein [Marinihelvus fidelis]|uniref:VWA domain-containing protein n=1 Tax=Marinihelvus fidelis TaxID=2613842 RepID=A0A5N0THS3_9GAMM|nr:VWA domain-containing protein [Marinihelvus fidelis]KAA9134038.1 VWA domain-containing protein [Marinihelvus fidelis]